MPRVLVAARVTVPRAREADYLATLAQLAARLKVRGEHLWLFRDPGAPGEFLEFRESSGAAPGRTRRAPDTEESALGRRLETIAAYAPESRRRWEEVSLEEC